MTDCYKFVEVSNLLYMPCRHPLELFSSSVWYNLLFADYLALLCVVSVVVWAGYASYRRARWRRLCGQHKGLRHDDGTDPRTGKQRYSYAKIRIKRRYWLVGEILSVSVYGLDTVTPGNVTVARESIANYVGVELASPSTKSVGAVTMKVNGLVKKNRGLLRRLER